MKKAISLALAFVLVLALSISAFATGNGISGNNSGTVEVKYTVSETYVVTIPAAQTFTETTLSTEGTVAATGVKLVSTHQLQVACKSLNGYKLKTSDGQSAIDYTVTMGASTVLTGVQEDTVVLTVAQTSAAAASDSVTLTFATTTDDIAAASAAGDHTDTLTFTCSVVDKQPE